jgi:hypothetical protein
MTFDQFYNSCKGKLIDYDRVSGAQCVDLAKVYLSSCFGIKPGAWGNAVDYYTNFEKRKPLVANFEKIANNPTFVPLKGDIVVWGAKIGPYGHIAVATGNGNTKWFESFDQNWPRGSSCKKVKHTYKGVLGVLRPKMRGVLFDYPKPKIGSTITLTYVRGVYKGAGANTGRKKIKELTSDGRKHCLNRDEKNNIAYLKRDTKCTIIELVYKSNKNIWARIPSGWICIYDYNIACKRYK